MRAINDDRDGVCAVSIGTGQSHHFQILARRLPVVSVDPSTTSHPARISLLIAGDAVWCLIPSASMTLSHDDGRDLINSTILSSALSGAEE